MIDVEAITIYIYIYLYWQINKHLATNIKTNNWNYLWASRNIYPSSSYCGDSKQWLTIWALVTAIRTWPIYSTSKEGKRGGQVIINATLLLKVLKDNLVRNCMYNCGLAAAGVSERLLDERSNITVKHVLLSRPHIFQAVVFPSPITVSATEGPFCSIMIVSIELQISSAHFCWPRINSNSSVNNQ